MRVEGIALLGVLTLLLGCVETRYDTGNSGEDVRVIAGPTSPPPAFSRPPSSVFVAKAPKIPSPARSKASPKSSAAPSKPHQKAVAPTVTAAAAPAPRNEPRRSFAGGFADLSAGRNQQAKAVFFRAISSAPDDPSAWFGLALAHERLNQRFDAATYYRNAARLGISVPAEGLADFVEGAAITADIATLANTAIQRLRGQ